MSGRPSGSSAERDYLPGCGWHWLLPLYDPMQRLVGVRGLHDALLDRAQLGAGQRVLDVGCGTGSLLIDLGRRRRDLQLVGVDPDPRALRRAQRKAARARTAVSWERGYAQQLPGVEASVDRVFCTLMFHHLGADEQDALLREVHRVLRPTGRLLFADLASGRHGRIDPADAARRMTAAGLVPDAPVGHRLRVGSVTIITAGRAA